MSDLSIPFNLDLLTPSEENLKGLFQVTSLDIFERGAGNNFNENGLFSIRIFGRTGDERRKRRFAYIDIKLPIFHPIIFQNLVSIKRLYGDIMSKKAYAIFDEEKKDFVRATPSDGKTGFQFFLSHWNDLVFPNKTSMGGELKLSLIEKYRKVATFSKIIVMPAGLRDIEYNENNQIVENEINNLYRKLIALSNAVSDSTIKTSLDILEPVQYAIQLTYNQIYDLIASMLEGKKKLVAGKWASRRVFNGTRNVITSMQVTSDHMDDKNTPGFNSTIIGLYQFMKTILPVARYKIRNGFLSEVFIARGQPVNLVDKKTLKSVKVSLDSRYFDNWASDEGIENLISAFSEQSIRHKEVEIKDHYLGLLYNDGHSFKLMHSIDELPEGRDPQHVKPLTLCELMYSQVYYKSDEYPLYVTRYPITGYGSIYPSVPFLKVTEKAQTLQELDENWNPIEGHVAHQFPTRSAFFDTFSPSSAHLQNLGADRTYVN